MWELTADLIEPHARKKFNQADLFKVEREINFGKGCLDWETYEARCIWKYSHDVDRILMIDAKSVVSSTNSG